MANKKVEALKEQLEMYTAEIDKYEKEFLANDGKINEQEQNVLDSIRGMLDKANAKLNDSKKIATSDEIEGIPIAFQKGFAQLKVATDKLEAKVEELKSTDKLEAAKDKLLTQLEKLGSNLPILKKNYLNTDETIQAACEKQLDGLKEQLNSIKNVVENDAKEEDTSPSLLDKVIDTVVPEEIQDKIKSQLNELRTFIDSVNSEFDKLQNLASKIKKEYKL